MALPRGLWIVVIVVAATLVLLAAVFRQGQPGRALTSTVPGIVTGAERFPSVVRCGGHVQYAGDAGASRMNTGGRGASSQRSSTGSVRAWFGVRDLVVRKEPKDFRFNASIDFSLDDEVTRRRLHEMARHGDPRVHMPDANMRTAERWMPQHLRLSADVVKSMSTPHAHKLWELFRLYSHYNTGECATQTPECLTFLDPVLAERVPRHTLVYRKCCVEHRILRDMAMWVFDVLEDAGIHVSLTSGALLGTVRDGGAMISSDTDIDLAICPEDKHKVFQLLTQASRPGVVSRVEWSPNKKNINVLYAAPPDDDPIPSAAHVEIYFVHRRDLWPRRSGPFTRCMFYTRDVWCPKLPDSLDSEYPGWKVPDRSPDVYGMYGLWWCTPTITARRQPCTREQVEAIVQHRIATGQ